MATCEVSDYNAGVRANIEAGYASGSAVFQRIQTGSVAELYVPPTAEVARVNMSTRLMFTLGSVARVEERVIGPLQQLMDRYGAKGVFPGKGDEGFHVTHQNGSYPGSPEVMPDLSNLDEQLKPFLVGLKLTVGECVPGVAITARFKDPDVALYYASLIAQEEYVRRGFPFRDYSHYKGATVGRLTGAENADLIGLYYAIRNDLNKKLSDNPFCIEVADVESMARDRFALMHGGITY